MVDAVSYAECTNCGYHPTLAELVSGDCQPCKRRGSSSGFMIFTIDGAEYIQSLLFKLDAAYESLKRANASAEKFEREWYLRGDELEAALLRLGSAIEIEYEEGQTWPWRVKFRNGSAVGSTLSDAVERLSRLLLGVSYSDLAVETQSTIGQPERCGWGKGTMWHCKHALGHSGLHEFI